MVVNQEISISNMPTVNAICVSDRRGIQKHPVESATLRENFGIDGDAHAGDWHRQISLLSKQDVDAFIARGAVVKPGDFGENIIVDGVDVSALPIGTMLQINNVLLRLTQRGKECHTHCQIYHKMGECIMPRLGVFAEVLHGGNIVVGDEIKIMDDVDTRFTAAVITMSDRCFNKESEDISGPTIIKYLEDNDYRIVETMILPDNKVLLKKELIRLADQREVDLILTTGGTGFSLRDVTPEATKEVIEREVPGISEAIRYESLKITKHAMLSRAVSGIRNKTLIINLPGSPKACIESMDVFIKTIPHGIRLLKGEKVDK